MKKQQKGFTLIELLVVIAVIGILAAVVLASLSSSRAKAKDKAIVSDLLSARTEMELYLGTNRQFVGSEVDDCRGDLSGEFGTTKMREILNHATTLTGDTLNGDNYYGVGKTFCFSEQGGNRWAIAVKLHESDSAWCVDSTGASRKTDISAGGIQYAFGEVAGVTSPYYQCI